MFGRALEFSRNTHIGSAGIFVLLKFENRLNRESIASSLNSKHHDKCKFALKISGLLTVSNLFPLEVGPKCQHCQLCVLRERSTVLDRNVERLLIRRPF